MFFQAKTFQLCKSAEVFTTKKDVVWPIENPRYFSAFVFFFLLF